VTKFRVILSPMAFFEIEAAVAWIAEESPASASRWRRSILKAIKSLASFPRRSPLAPESLLPDEEYRQLLVGRGRLGYRAVIAISGDEVRILRVRRIAQDALLPDDRDESDEATD
jgi:plasmid stabilization system protein ParE